MEKAKAKDFVMMRPRVSDDQDPGRTNYPLRRIVDAVTTIRQSGRSDAP